ncbi:Cupin domain protein [Tenacibaculum sp. MAR_2009_124]|uniref:aspartyl/asparaginyl beta-hydroxylase domain-containing protein n=1 Tax=Tenacibaculum sp. MAR_2009_124 TaxID=1250059 RepID=UPI000897E0A5|nr:aspartyl/asparaginyl beta-hydroxylase domain-containing protein [Tenacibaculum sp. MAR_2009_124]SEB75548.1 Cupin domain protein [Tenacibaculum sp. MAR_2009_124]
MSETQSIDVRTDRIKLPFNFDIKKMLEEFEILKQKHLSYYDYYDAIPLRSPAHLVDSSIPFPPPADDYADGSWTAWLDTEKLKDSEYLTSIVAFFKKNTKVTLVRLLRLAPGQVVKEHTDPTLALEVEKSVVRLTIPIISNEKVTFYLNNIPVNMQPGECWYLKLNDPHMITNYGEEERVNLTIDMIPNEWLRNIIKENINQ